MAIAEPIEALPPHLAPKPRLRGFFDLVAFPVSIVTGTVLVLGVVEGTRDRIGALVYAVACMILFGASATGAVVYARRRPDPVPAVFGYHEIFHLGTIVGFATHDAAVTLALV